MNSTYIDWSKFDASDKGSQPTQLGKYLVASNDGSNKVLWWVNGPNSKDDWVKERIVAFAGPVNEYNGSQQRHADYCLDCTIYKPREGEKTCLATMSSWNSMLHNAFWQKFLELVEKHQGTSLTLEVKYDHNRQGE